MTNPPDTAPEPRGDLAARVIAMPADTNHMGNIFGGYIMSLMDIAGGISAGEVAQGPVVTVSVSNIAFLQPVKVGDVVSCYTELVKIGRTSLTIAIEVWVSRNAGRDRRKVTEAEFAYVAVDEAGKPRPVRPPA